MKDKARRESETGDRENIREQWIENKGSKMRDAEIRTRGGTNSRDLVHKKQQLL